MPMEGKEEVQCNREFSKVIHEAKMRLQAGDAAALSEQRWQRLEEVLAPVRTGLWPAGGEEGKEGDPGDSDRGGAAGAGGGARGHRKVAERAARGAGEAA